MLQFLKYVLATVVGLLLFFVVSMFLLIGIGASLSTTKTVTVADNSVLGLNLNTSILEVGEENPFAEFTSPFLDGDESLGLKDIKSVLKSAATDDKIKGIYLRSEVPSAGWATLEEIRNSLLEFKESGKFIYTYGESYSEKGYYLASVADSIYLTEVGDFEWNGLSAEYEFYKGTLDKLDITPEIFKVGEFKSAVEPFIRTDMSEASRQQTKQLLEGINNHFLEGIGKSRKIEVSQLKLWADELAINSAQDAFEKGLISKVGYLDEFESALKSKVGATDKVNIVKFSDYQLAAPLDTEGDFNNRIAVIIAEGSIVSGKETDGVIASENFVKQIKKIRENDKVKAVVLRINSPGGSALASDVMWREIKLTSEKKPVIASMGDVAASGGYYMAMACDTIVAQPNTITGSIGIYGMMFNIENFLKNKIGLTFDRVNTSNYSDSPTVTRALTPFEKQKIQSMVEKGYETFTSKAAQGRHMDIEKLKSVASGRVWSGIDAKEKGLVDTLGGINTAIEVAANAANLTKGDYRVRYYPEKRDIMADLLDKMGGSDEGVASRMGEMGRYWLKMKQINQYEGIQARMPFMISID